MTHPTTADESLLSTDVQASLKKACDSASKAMAAIHDAEKYLQDLTGQRAELDALLVAMKTAGDALNKPFQALDCLRATQEIASKKRHEEVKGLCGKAASLVCGGRLYQEIESAKKDVASAERDYQLKLNKLLLAGVPEDQIPSVLPSIGEVQAERKAKLAALEAESTILGRFMNDAPWYRTEPLRDTRLRVDAQAVDAQPTA